MTDDEKVLDSANETMMRNVNDQQRLQVIAALVNCFNFAVQVQANRNNWNENDARAFAIALGSIDSIGLKVRQAQAEPIPGDLEEGIARLATSRNRPPTTGNPNG